MKRFVLLLLLTVPMLAQPANIHITGNDLYEWCQTNGDTNQLLRCSAFIDGVVGGNAWAFPKGIEVAIAELKNQFPNNSDLQKLDWAKASQLILEDAGKRGISNLWCLEVGSSQKQLIDVVEKFLKEHPETRNQPAENAVVNALSTAFPPPCKVLQ